MARKKHRVEQVINKLREAEVELAKGQTVRAACRKLGVSEHTYYRWRKEYGGMRVDQTRQSNFAIPISPVMAVLL